jgi:hypothetical protein
MHHHPVLTFLMNSEKLRVERTREVSEADGRILLLFSGKE